MSNRPEDAVRGKTIAVLNDVEHRVVEFAEVFQEVARGAPLDSQRAENLSARCGELLKHIVETRNLIRLSGPTAGLH